jgi:hypothetical protein
MKGTTTRVAAAPVKAPSADENVWVIDKVDEDDGDDLDKESALDLSGGEWEPAGLRLKRRLAAWTKRLR